jgi:hypothetical protein
MRKIMGLILTVALVISIPAISYAEKPQPGNELSDKELKILTKKVGLTEEEISNDNVEHLRYLIENGAKKIGSKKKGIDFSSEGAPQNDSGEFSTMGTLTQEDMTLWGTVYELYSDRAGDKKLHLYANFNWNIEPTWVLTDKLAIGFPDSAQWVLPFRADGNPDQFDKRYCAQFEINYEWVCENSDDTNDFEAGFGVAASYDLLSGRNDHKGYVTQNVYLDNSDAVGNVNVIFTYGHRFGGGTISVTPKPSGLGFTPSTYTEELKFGLEFDLDTMEIVN